MTIFNHLDILEIGSTEDISSILAGHGCELALIKKLPKNANDKNQVYFHHDANLLNSVFDMSFSERVQSTSITKRMSAPGKPITQAIFGAFYWVSVSGNLHKAKQCKAIVYHQYPEARLSGFQTVENEMPQSMSVEYTKSDNLLDRFLVLGATPKGEAVAVMVVNPSNTFKSEFDQLPNYGDSKICKHLVIKEAREDGSVKLKKMLIDRVAGKTLQGCRFDKDGNTIPFTSTQVHGYTLEHALGIIPNADQDGDIFGIELKCFTSKKLSLITTEPDGGLYKDSFADFMKTYGYMKGEDYRLTGLHRANATSDKTGLTLRIYCYPVSKNNKNPAKTLYDKSLPFARQMNGMQVLLEDFEGNIAASWSIERLLNKWGAKHNEVVYVPAKVSDNEDIEQVDLGYTKQVTFETFVLWCNRTTVEQLINSINEGVIFLDPAPKYNEIDKKRNKRRSQWRLNNIYVAAKTLYEVSEIVDLK